MKQLVSILTCLTLLALGLAVAHATNDYDIPDLLQYASGPISIEAVGTQAVMNQSYRSNYWKYVCKSDLDWLPSYIDAITEGDTFSFLKEEKNTYFFRYTGDKSVRSIDTPAMRTDVEHELVIWLYFGDPAGTKIYLVAAPELTYTGDYVKANERYENGKLVGTGSEENRGQAGSDLGGGSWDSTSESVKGLCWKCHGEGRIDCTQCNGSGGKWVYSQVPNYGGSTSPNNTAQNWENCFKCGGSGKITCPNCGGSGYT